jgi:glutamine amidotransferase
VSLVLVDYGAGNLKSAANALLAAGARSVTVSADPDAVAAADRLVLPGVGAFGACIGAIRAIDGLEDALTLAVRGRSRPFLGICVGMQLLADRGEEFGVHAGLGWIPGTVRRLAPTFPGLKIPQIGWNAVTALKPGPVESGWAYFVHSYALVPERPADVAATADYGGTVVAAVQRETMLGVQFHPEKSQRFGLALLARFLEWRP